MRFAARPWSVARSGFRIEQMDSAYIHMQRQRSTRSRRRGRWHARNHLRAAELEINERVRAQRLDHIAGHHQPRLSSPHSVEVLGTNADDHVLALERRIC